MVPQMTLAQLSAVRNVAITREYVDAAPVMFFAKNSTEVVGTTKTQSQLQQVVASAISEYMRQHPEAKLTLVGSAAFDEDQAVARERVSYVTRLLGLPTEQLERRLVIQTAPEYPELAEEHRSVQFLVNGTPQIFRVERTKDSIETVTPLRIPVGHLVTCDTSCSSNLTANIAGRILRVEGDAPTYTVVVDSTALQLMQRGEYAVIRGQVAFEATTTSSQEQVSYTNIDPRVTVRLLPAGQPSGNASSTLCFFDFNGAVITSFNERAFSAIKDAIANGKRVEIIATTDHLGTDASNAVLAERRAATAIERLVSLGIPKDRIITATYQSIATENTTPMERIANRSVKMIIRD
jgi:outer membrane protein OmpA-like peptidoglycan-associated protein